MKKLILLVAILSTISFVGCGKNEVQIIEEAPAPSETESQIESEPISAENEEIEIVEEDTEETEETPQTEEKKSEEVDLENEEKALAEEIVETPKAEVIPKAQEEPTVKPVENPVDNNNPNWNHNYDAFYPLYQGEKPGYVFQPAFGEYVTIESTISNVVREEPTEEALAWGDVPWGSAAAWTNDISRKDEIFMGVRTLDDWDALSPEDQAKWDEWQMSLNK